MIIIDVLAAIAFLLIGLQFLTALFNSFSSLIIKKSEYKYDKMLSVLIPARNEEQNIANLLTDLINQDYQNIEIIVYDDQSDDRTAEIVENFGVKDSRIKLIKSNGLKSGWLGKPHACYELSRYAAGDYYLFLDADVRIGRHIIGNSIAYAVSRRIELLSIFPKQIMQSFGEIVTVPLMNYILLSMLPLLFVRKTEFIAFAAANGQFMLFNSIFYKILQPHKFASNKKVEDIAIARYYKKNRVRTSCNIGDDEIQCRMYDAYSSAINGFSKNFTEFFGGSATIAIIFWFITSFGFVFVYFSLGLNLLLIYLSIFFGTRIIISAISRQSIIRNVLYIVFHQFAFAHILIKYLSNLKRKNFVWKGRNIS